jgi:molybdopterin-guanine dinucleotide biosynthesis protein A
MVTAPCDAPLLPLDLVARLNDALQAEAADVAVARSPSGPQSAFMLCRISLRQSIEDFLASGQRALHLWLAERHSVEVPFADESAFVNVNTPEDMARLDQLGR